MDVLPLKDHSHSQAHDPVPMPTQHYIDITTKRCRGLLNSRSDAEQVALDIVAEAWHAGIRPSKGMIRFRCIDEHRKAMRQDRVMSVTTEELDVMPSRQDVVVTEGAGKDEVDRIMASCTLSSREKLLVFKLFYLDMSRLEVGREMNMTKHELVAMLEGMFDKMRRCVERTKR